MCRDMYILMMGYNYQVVLIQMRLYIFNIYIKIYIYIFYIINIINILINTKMCQCF